MCEDDCKCLREIGNGRRGTAYEVVATWTNERGATEPIYYDGNLRNLAWPLFPSLLAFVLPSARPMVTWRLC